MGPTSGSLINPERNLKRGKEFVTFFSRFSQKKRYLKRKRKFSLSEVNILPSSKLIIDMHHEPFGWNIHSLNLTWPLKNGGWETILSFWGPAYFILFLTGAMLKGGQAINKIRLTNGHMLPGKGPRLMKLLQAKWLYSISSSPDRSSFLKRAWLDSDKLGWSRGDEGHPVTIYRH